jgi:hypothetical protein
MRRPSPILLLDTVPIVSARGNASDGVFRSNLDSPMKLALSGFVKYANALAQLQQGRVLPR